MKEGISYFTDTYLTSGGLVLFFVFFVGVVWWVNLPMNRARFLYDEKLPLEHGEKYE